MSDLLLNLQYLMTSGADHLTGNLEQWELVYWSSGTNLQPREWTNNIIEQYMCTDYYSQKITNTVMEKLLMVKVVPGHPKIWHLHLNVIWHKTVPGSLRKKEKQRRVSILKQQRHQSELKKFLLFYQIPVDEVGTLQVGHALADILTHPPHHALRQMPLPVSQVVWQAAVFHQLKHKTHGRTLGAHTVELHQPRVGQLPVKAHTYTCISPLVFT